MKILSFCALLGLASCSTTNTDAQTVFALVGAYTAAATAEAAYLALPPCGAGTPVCSDPAVAVTMKHYDLQAYNALQPVLVAAQSGGSVIDAAALEAAEAAVSTLTSYQQQQGVK